LHQNLVAPQVNGLLDFFEQFLAFEDVSLVRLWRPVERAKIAHRRADVGVVDVAIDVVGAIRLGMQSSRYRIGRAGQRV
jgi:hypothetical protein